MVDSGMNIFKQDVVVEFVYLIFSAAICGHYLLAKLVRGHFHLFPSIKQTDMSVYIYGEQHQGIPIWVHVSR